MAEWQTRLFKGQVRKSVGSTPTARTKKVLQNKQNFFYYKSKKNLKEWESNPRVRGVPKNAKRFRGKGFHRSHQKGFAKQAKLFLL